MPAIGWHFHFSSLMSKVVLLDFCALGKMQGKRKRVIGSKMDGLNYSHNGCTVESSGGPSGEQIVQEKTYVVIKS